jgi:hypothetical protein
MGPGEASIEEAIEEAYETISQSEEAVEAVVYEIEHGDDD